MGYQKLTASIICPYCGGEVWIVPIFMPEEGKIIIGFTLEKAHFCGKKNGGS